MNFDFSDDQKNIQDQARSMLAKECNSSVVRHVIDTNSGFDEALWQQIIALGWPAISIPEQHGGLGLSYLELCVIATELGRSLAPVPFIASVYLGTEIIKAAASEQQQAEWLPELASGEVISTVAIGSDKSSCRVSNDTLNGSKSAVLHGMIANRAIVAASDEQDELQLYLVDLHHSSIQRTTQNSLDPSLPRAELVFNNTPAIKLSGTLSAKAAISRVFDRAAVLLAFEQVGGSEAAIDMAKAYTTDRYAFGRQVASFQAIKHKLADMFVAKELAKSNAYYGAWALSADAPELALAAATARVSGIDAYYLCSKENIQAHGGMGFTWEFDCHLYYRRAQALSTLLGGNPYWKSLLVDRLLAA
ncbi:acyl-CoA dehydrogenase family protein [uncultured Zhongshania sp.]|jgi:alkylation response protein AidB-like acyl-CoA dehydrogenase|uniref:acyl-CoA dehydrogenase family protein n=1 Tax=uncultured Zhongshania sp. TaxID=1642288 RepID=UPI0025D43372|nr:acyl-CoA dehydrogenase family protein [uncultured Zhongshania sp.]|tara:strand:+ start:3835 stop:4920 length:1086 start_codon:yes stop_codon:yes gene_type:complete